MYVLITCKYRKDQIINSREKAEISFSIIILLGFFSDAQGQLRVTPQSVVGSSDECLCTTLLQTPFRQVSAQGIIFVYFVLMKAKVIFLN